MKASQGIKDYIKKIEGFRARPYLDPPLNVKGKYSTGYGHSIQPNEKALMTKVLTKAEADLMFDIDFRVYESAVNINLKHPVTQNQFDALCDFAYNEGTGAVAKIINTWNGTQSIPDTVQHIRQYVKASGVVNKNLVARREYEVGLWGTLETLKDAAEKKNG